MLGNPEGQSRVRTRRAQPHFFWIGGGGGSGDEVYPRATRDDYKWRFEMPYEYAFPKSSENDTPHPALFMLPGNHDWYDGLNLFLAKYCRGAGEEGKGLPFAKSNWQLFQDRSYFAVKLPNNWWIFGIDTQLCEDIDKPQEDYFINIMSAEQNQAAVHRIIICCAAPTWMTAKNKDAAGGSAYSRGIDHFVSNTIGNLTIHLVQ